MHKWNLQHNGVTAQNVNAVWQKTNANTSYLIKSNPCHNQLFSTFEAINTVLVIFKTLDVAFQVWDSVEDTLVSLHTVNISFNVGVSFDVSYSGDCICRMALLAQHSSTYLLLEHAKPNTSKGISREL